MIEIVDWINSIHDALDLGDILAFAKKAQEPGVKVTMVTDDWIAERAAVVLYRGEGTTDEVRAAFFKAVEKNRG